MDQQSYRKLISGRQKGACAASLRLLLVLPATAYSTGVILRNFLYSKSWLKTNRVDAAVISVGNITTGGTGKTPLVIWLADILRAKNIPCAILTRGYKATQKSKTQNYTDEPAIFAQACPHTKVIVNPNRTDAAKEAIGKFGAKVLIMDDGFQHRRLQRDLDIVTIDATQPFGFDKMLPSGLLREPITALERADVVVITRCDQVSQADLDRIEETIQSVKPNMAIARAVHAPATAKLPDEQQISIDELKGKKVFSFCGIANPNSFLQTLKSLGADIVGSKTFNDHYHYTEADIDNICTQACDLNADLILTTQKDWTKIPSPTPKDKHIPLAYLAIQLKFIAGQDKITQLIDGVLAGKILHKQ